jgi:ligand-binding sensor domain-containing protein/two-component sensor histidine kinase
MRNTLSSPIKLAKWPLLLLALLSCSFIASNAQQNNIVFTHFTRHNYLATNYVNFVLQDKKEFMWFATSNGLHCFDGNRWLLLQQDNTKLNALPDNYVYCLLQDNKERFWVATAKGICLLNCNTLEFSNVPVAWPKEIQHIEINAIKQLKDGNIWFTLKEGGLYKYDEIKKEFVSSAGVLPGVNSTIYHIEYDSSKQQYWLGTTEGILLYDARHKKKYDALVNTAQLKIFTTPESKKRPIAMHLNEKGELWYNSWHVNRCYNLTNNSIIFTDSNSKGWGFRGYYTDRLGTTWGYGIAAAKMDLKKGAVIPIEQNTSKPYGISYESAPHFTEDREHNYWIATSNGIFTYNRFYQQFFFKEIRSNTTGLTLPLVDVTAFTELPDSSILIHTWGHEGMYHYDKNINPLPTLFNFGNKDPIDNLALNQWCSVKDNDNIVWIGCQRGMIVKYNPFTKRIKKIQNKIFNNKTILSITKDREGNIWFGTVQRAIIKWNVATNTFVQILPLATTTYEMDNVFQLLYDGEKYIWAATTIGGLFKINTHNNSIEKQYLPEKNKSDGLPIARINDITAISFNELALATPAGIVIMNITTEKFKVYNTENGLPENSVFTIQKAKDKSLWFACNNGIGKMSLDNKRITEYGLTEGLTSETYLRCSKLLLSDGRMLFGNAAGYTFFTPEKFKGYKVPPDVVITGIKLFDNYLNLDSILTCKDQLRLTRNQNFITIEFSNMSFLLKDQTEYFYQLEGIDNDWIRAGEKQQAVYNYLPAGNYVFKVKCKSRDGRPSEKITSLNITIIPPYWKRWWFYLLLLSASGGVAYLFYKIRERRKKETESVRKRIARDLHDDMGSTLSTINILSEMAKMKVETDTANAKLFIDQISDNSNRIMESMDDIVWSIDPVNDSMENIVSRMREFAGNLFEAKEITYTFKEEESIKNLNLALGKRHDFFMIFKEAVNNMAKYSGCTNASIEISVVKNKLVLLITDNGKGFNVNTPENGNGLENMRKRAAALGADLDIISEPDKGTRVFLLVPL